MKVTYNWLKDFVALDIPPKALAEKLTMAGLEVTAQQERGADRVFEIEVTSNRPDWLGVIGIAREVAAITGKKLKSVEGRRDSFRLPSSTFHPISVSIEDKKDCPLYTATIIKGVKVAASPQWLARRLESLGCRSINNIVDITNYVLFETGQPLHAFDLDKLSASGIIVRRAKSGEKLITLDGQEKVLDPQILAIADKDKVVALAGIMGGRDTEVSAATKDILLEAAVFDPVAIRRGRRQLGLQSESSYRFERGVDAGALDLARRRAVELILQIAGGNCVLAKSAGRSALPKTSIVLDCRRVSAIMGEKISPQRAKNILSRLGFQAKTQAGNKLKVEAPSYRQDVKLEVDLIEEISRISGYDRVPATIPAQGIPPAQNKTRALVLAVKNALVGLGLNEAITYSLIDKEILERFGWSTSGLVEVRDPLSREQEILRPSLIPALVRCVAYNLNQRQEYVNIFEISKVFSAGSRPQEKLALGIALCGEKAALTEDGLAKERFGMLHLKGIVESLFSRLGIREYDFTAQGTCRAVVSVGGRQSGVVAAVTKDALGYLDIKNKAVFGAEILLDDVFACAGGQKKFRPLPLYPAVSRDISFTSAEDIPAKEILEAIRACGRPLLESAAIADYYKGKQVPQGQRGLTVSCLYRLGERTLTDAEVAPVHERVCSLLKERFGAKLR